MITFGLDKKSKEFLKIADKIIVAGAFKGFKPAFEEIVKEAKRKAPVRTGRLRDNIISIITNEMVTIEASVKYAAHVEKYQPFLFPSAEEKQDRVNQIILDHITEEWESN